MNNYTKGPWTAKFEAELENEYSIYESDRHICNVHGGQSEDAALIASAPEMLEALEAAYHAIELTDETKDAFCLVNEAIAKAKGGDPMIKSKLLGSSPTHMGVKQLIEKYWYSEPNSVKLGGGADGLWHVFQSGKLMDGYRVVERKGRFRFESLGGAE